MPNHAELTPGRVCHWQAGRGFIIAEHAQALIRIDAVADDILRIRVAPAGRLAPSHSWQDESRSLAGGRLSIEERAHALHLETGAMRARLDLDTGALSLGNADGAVYASDLAPVRWRHVERHEIPTLAPALAPAVASTVAPVAAPSVASAAASTVAPAATPSVSSAAAPTTSQQPVSGWPTGPATTGLWLQKALDPQEGLFGCGQRFGALNRRGQRLAHWTTDINSPGLGVVDGCLYQSHPVLLALRPGLAWGLMLGSSGYSHFDLGAEQSDTLGLFSLGGELDYYLFAGPTPAAVVEQLTRLTGRPALPPLWALGYHQSRWGYRSDAEIRAIANEFRRRRIPIDAIHLDIDYMDGFRVFSWDRERFPSPRTTVEALHQQDIHAVTIIDPGVKRIGSSDPVLETGLRGDHFVRRPDGEHFTGYVWPGESLFPDFCRTATRRWWGDLHAGLLDAGVDGIWCDMNEPAIVDRPFEVPGATALAIPLDAKQGDDAETCHAEAHNRYGTLMARATYEGLQRLRPKRRPWVLTRSASMGAQRWAVSWMGDNASSWEDLRTSLPQLASMGLSGSPHVGVDIGGFYGACNGELFARWIELGAFYPFMRAHAYYGSPPQEPWAFGDAIEAVARTAIERRYQFLPYLYTLAHRTHRTGEPILRPLLYDFPQATELHGIEDQLMVGPQLMIAPVCEPGVSEREVLLPPGAWYDFHTGRRIDDGSHETRVADANARDAVASASINASASAGGNASIDVKAGASASAMNRRCLLPAPPGRMPILVRGGSCLTLGPTRQSTREPLTELILDAYPDEGQSGSWTLIEDAGDGEDDGNDPQAETALTVTTEHAGPTLMIGPRQSGWQPHPRQLVLRLHLAQQPEQVLLDAVPQVDWRWDQADHAAVVSLDDDGDAHQLSLE
ncbi:TIM-barrel domain-containing protein [Halochromatium salexigens]|uniref:Alpha-glucosidase n=1 Tax=Halochromatium salexigens TaxID=49447 RepID=A0AAJ0UHB4_HALSE|nr:TIM-barrel domain-containing protein [Halochromatium salexigens]MBK5931474.1 alpha-glucosidase [Halochromatium salexigens]